MFLSVFYITVCKKKILKNFLSFIKQHELFTHQQNLLVACSGGVDSMVLCDLLRQHQYNFAMAHCNFRLRGNESNADEQLVKHYAVLHGITVHVTHFDTDEYAAEKKLSIQLAARELRYQWFDDLLNEYNYDYLLTAHHAGDNTETVLMNFFKGTGIHGITGIALKRDKIVRPLLFAAKKEIVEYAGHHGISWREDASNASDKYARNFFRNRIIPQVEEMIPNASGNVNETIKHLQDAELLYLQAIEFHRRQLLESRKQEIHIPVAKFAAVVPFETIAYELLKPFGFKAHQVGEIRQLLQAETGRYIACDTHRIIKNRRWLIIAPLAANDAENIVIDEEDKKVLFPNGTLQITNSLNKEFSKDLLTVTLDAKKLAYPLLLRKWKTGDYFYPLGMPKKKKIARFMIDQKLSATDKEKLWVLVSSNKIVWVVGHRIDDRFKITDVTKEVLKIRVENKD
jgi:tRNA(Ile)-lysidine synthase